MAWTFANFAESLLTSGVNDSVTTWTVADGSVFPASGDFVVRCGGELAKCTARSGNDLTVVRGSESTTAASHASAAAVRQVLSKAVLDGFSQGAGSGTVTSVGITQPAAGITVSGSPVTTSGSMTLALANDLAGLEGQSGTGIVTRTGDGTYAQRTITGTADQIDVSNGSGVSGNPTLSIPSTFTRDLSQLRGFPGICGFRLTLESGVPLSTTDQTAKTTLYLTPDPLSPWCGIISNYESSVWVPRKFAEVSLSLSGYTAAKPYDIFAYVTSSTLTLESVVWTNGTTRATALATQDSRYVKTSAADRLYVGTIYTSATGQCEFSPLATTPKLYLSNMYNRRSATIKFVDSTSTWTYGTASYRQARASAANQFEYVSCDGTHEINVVVACGATGNNLSAGVGVGVDSTTTNSAQTSPLACGGTTSPGTVLANYVGRPAAGYHYVAWLEYASGANITFRSNSLSGLTARVEC